MLDKIVFETNVPQTFALKFGEGKLVESKFKAGGEYYFTTDDDRCFYLPLQVGEIIHKQLAAQQIKAHEEAMWMRAEIREKGRVCPRWQVQRVGAVGEQVDGTIAVQAPATRPATSRPSPATAPQVPSAEAARRASIERAKARVFGPPEPDEIDRYLAGAGVSETPAPAAQVTAPVVTNNTRIIPPPPRTKLEDAFCTIALALLHAEQYAKSIGYEAWPKQFSSEDVRTLANTIMINHREGQR